MSSTELLGIYLTDHLAGSTAALDHLEKVRSDSEESPLGVFLAELAREIRADRETLEDLIDRLGVGKNPLKQAAASIVEKLGRVKFTDQLSGGPELRRLLELEALQLGIEGKHAMWRALKRTVGTDSRFSGVDFDDLIERARQQYDAVEGHRLEVAAAAFAA
jgi:hypothetical protein